MRKTIYLKTMGCPKNQVDSRQMAGMLAKGGYNIVDAPQAAEIILLNTCGFVDEAKEESIQALLELAQYKTMGMCKTLVMLGCMVQKYGDELAENLDEVDFFMGTSDWIHLLDALDDLHGQAKVQVGKPEQYLFNNEWIETEKNEPHTGYVKIAEGCDHHCTYCVIPNLRGCYRSRSIQEIVEEVQKRAEAGLREAVLVAQDTGCYGKDLEPRQTLAELIQALCGIEKLEWIRIMYCYPEEIDDRLLQAMKHKKVCPYLDMPIQHVSDPILKAMGRPFTKKQLVDLIHKVRREIPRIFIRTTLMLGFPGEKPEHFDELLSFLTEERLERAGFFAFSPQPGTPAERLPHPVAEEEKQRRLALAQSIQAEILAERESALIGQLVQVMVDRLSEDQLADTTVQLWEGRTCWDAPEIDGLVIFRSDKNHFPGQLVQVKVTHSHEYTLLGEIFNESC